MKIDKIIKKQKMNKYARRALIILLPVAVITIGLLLFLANQDFFNKKNAADSSIINLDPPTEEQKQAGEDIKKTTNEYNTNNELGLSFGSINQINDQLKVKITISGLVSNNGLCNLKLQKDNQSFEYTKPTFALTSYSTCQGFDIDIKDYSRGEWIITLLVSTNDKSSTINKTITLE